MPSTSTELSRANNVDDYRWLTGPQAAEFLAISSASPRSLAAEIKHLRRALSAERAHLIVELVELRRRAQDKFALAGQMFFTRRGLEQATDEIVAGYKALRFAQAGKVIDLCAGVGGDLLALANVVSTTGLDRDPIMVTIAQANARVAQEQTLAGRTAEPVDVRVQDVADANVQHCSAWHIDPDRRPSGRRTTRVALHEPGVETLERLRAANPNAAIKLAPAAELPETWSGEAELEWIGRSRQCRQLVAWFGELAISPGERRATILGSQTSLVRTIVGTALEEPKPVGRVGRFVFEPDATVLAAQLGGALAAEHDLARITRGIAYWTGDAPIDDAALACFEVHAVLPLDVKRVRDVLAARNIGRLEIKKRGVDCQPESLRRQLRPTGSEAGTLLVTRIEGRVTAIIAQRRPATMPSSDAADSA